MSFKQSLQALNKVVVPSADQSGDTLSIFADYALNGVALAAGDIIEMLPLPAGYVPVDVIAASPDLDSGGSPAITLDVGLLSGAWGKNSASSTIGAEFISASTVGQAGGIARMSNAAGALLAPDVTQDRSVGIKVGTGPATGATTGTIRLTMLCRPQVDGA